MAYTPPFMLATGDYEGRICVWNIHTGERRCTLTHEAPKHQRGVEQLLFLQTSNPSAPPILLSCGGKLAHDSFPNLSCEASMKLVVIGEKERCCCLGFISWFRQPHYRFSCCFLSALNNRVGKAEEEGREGDGGVVWQVATLQRCQSEL